MTVRVFIDGEAGTTGLQIRNRLEDRADVTLLQVEEARRKDPEYRAAVMNEADLVVLCLPDAAAREAVGLIENPAVKLVDASSAHRTDADWVYGFPELDAAQAERIAAAQRVTNPGCYPTGAVGLIRPLIAAGLLPADFAVTVNAVSGYSGGGRQLIETYEGGEQTLAFSAYGLTLEHKHTEEMRVHAGLDERPLFMPSVGNYRQGMLVQVPLQLWALPGDLTSAGLREALADHYRGQAFVSVASLRESDEIARLGPEGLNGTNEMRLFVFGNDNRRQAVLVALLDNLGKGASGAAVQNLNLMLGLVPESGLISRRAA